MSTTAGIDIGSEAIKGIVLKAGKKGPVEVIGAGTMPINELTRMPESEDRALAIGEKLKELVKSARLRADTRRLGASGGRATIRYLQIPPVPPWRLEMLVKYEVEERAEEKETNAYDYHIMDVPEASGQYTVLIGMCRDSYAFELMSQAKSSGLGDIEIDLEALALYAAYYHGHGYDPDKTVAIADIGADELTVLVCKNGALYYARTMLGGGRRFTQNLADDLKLEWADADELKRTSAEISFDVGPSAASSVGRTARVPRPGGTTMLPRPQGRTGGTAILPGGEPRPQGSVEAGTPGTGLPARSAVTQAPGAASGTSGAAEEIRRARVPDAAKLVRPAAGNGASAVRQVPASSSTSVPVAPASAAEPSPVTESAPKVVPMKLSGEVSYNIPSLEELDLSSVIPSKSPAAEVPAPIAPPKPVPVPVKAAPVKIDEFELQPLLGDEKSEKPVQPKAASPAATVKLPAPVFAPAAPPSGSEIVDLFPVQDVPKQATGASTVMMSAPDALDPFKTTILPSPEAPDEKDKRKRQISAALVREAAGLCAAIENVVLNSKQQSKQAQLKLDRLYITGGGSKLKGLPEFMSRRLRVEVQPLEPLRNLSLDRLSPAAADALREEQHTLCIALGLALSDLRKGAFNFVLLPQSVKNRKEFWARGAYLYYAAGAAALAVGALMYTPTRNTERLAQNAETADTHAKKAKTENEEIRKLTNDNDELRHRLKTIDENVQSGDYFLTLLGELKSKQRIQDNVYLTSLSTSIPNVVLYDAKGDDTPEGIAKGVQNAKEELAKALAANKEPDTFQAQKRVYLRGFVRGKNKEDLIQPIQAFFDKLVPVPLEPDNPRNLFKDIRPLWYSRIDNQKDGLFLKEFVLEAYTAAPMKEVKKEEPKNQRGRGAAKPTANAQAPAANPAQPAAVRAEQVPQPPQLVPVPLERVPVPTQPVQVVPIQPLQPVPNVPVQVVPPPNINTVPQIQPVQAPSVKVPQVQVPPVQVPPVQVPPVQVQPVQPIQIQPAQGVPAPVQPTPPIQAIPPVQQPPQPVNPAVPQPKRKTEYVQPDDQPVPAPK